MFIAARNLLTVVRLQALTASGSRAKHTLPNLSYDYSALEPIICREIMELHHTKHHQTYVNNLNAAEEQIADAISKKDVSKAIALGGALKFNGGGHVNHTILWQNLTPNKTDQSKEFKDAITQAFGSFENFKKEFTTMTVGIQGSGWGWLGYNKKSKQLQLATCANQDPLEATTGLVPLFGIDVWEHAYYIQYKNVRPSYVEAIYDIANWKDISDRFHCAKQ